MLDFLGELKRTHYCGELRAAHEGQSVTLLGWVHGRRDLGNLIFLDVRDRAGIAQVVFNKETDAASHAKAEQARSEFVVAVEGRVAHRQKANPAVPTGEVEVIATSLRILNTAKTPPFPIEEQINATEETRLRYRYLDLRRPKPQSNLALRHRVILELRKAMDEMGFYEVETPMLTRSTPEGARDYLVPSRVHTGKFYALPQSPQIFKQILMISGLDKYFQIARCFRDEDLRADRQPDFTQLDLEMSFVRPEDVWEVIERVCARMWAVGGFKIATPFRRMSYKDAMRRYGSDKPDLRFGMELQDVTAYFMRPEAAILQVTGNVYALVAPGAAESRGLGTRKHVDELVEKAKSLGAKACYTTKVTAEGVQSGLEKTLGAETLKQMAAAIGAKPGDLIVAIASKDASLLSKGIDHAAQIAGQVRLYLGDKLGLIDRTRWEFLWLTGFPLFEWAEKENAWFPAQHPFTGVVEEDLDLLEQPARHGEIRSKGYDLVLNGIELGSGSVRIHRQDIQARVFKALGLTEEQAKQRFGFFLDALTYGTPPHGGIALGLDRVAMLIAGETSIREVIAFAKTAQAVDLMADSPNLASQEQVEELNIIPAFANLSGHERKLLSLNDFLIHLGVKQIYPTLPTAQTPFDGFVRGTFVASLNMAKGIVLLGKSVLGHQGQALLRSLLEAGINLEYVFQDKSRADGFWEAGDKALAKLARKLDRESLVANYSAQPQGEQSLSAIDTWSRIPLRERAHTIGFQWAYDYIYELSSSIIHMDARVAATHQDLDPTKRWVGQMLGGCYILMNMISRSVVKAFQLKQFEKTLDEHYKEFQDCLAEFKNAKGPSAGG